MVTFRFSERRRRRRAQALSRAVMELPPSARRAMLAALEADDQLVGAYTNSRGGVCPMLAAHRRGARTDVGNFPRAWDGFARARRPRPATERELDILKALRQETSSHGGTPGEPLPAEREARERQPVRQAPGDPHGGVSLERS